VPTVVTTRDEVHFPKTATIRPAIYDIPATDPEITRFFPMPPPPGATRPILSNPTDPPCVAMSCHPSGLTEAVLGGALGNYFDPMSTGASAVFRVVVQQAQAQDDVPPDEAGQEVTGGGFIPVGNDKKARFGFAVKKTSSGTTKGRLVFHNRATGEKVYSEQITSLDINVNTATFTGTGRNASGTRCDFKVTVQDNSKDGKLDTFKIEDDTSNLLPPCAVAGPATLGGGNIVIHNS
jgi:hypothetical protein